MQVPLQITIRDMEHSDAIDGNIRQRAERLERLHPRITSCRVAIEKLNKHSTQGQQFQVRVDVRAPGHSEIISTRHHHEDVYVAIRDAFDAVGRRLEDTVREQRGKVKHHEITQHGKVARIFADEGYGFIEADDGGEFYFSRENVAHPSFDELDIGTPVHFLKEMAVEGSQAKRVTVVRHGE